VGARGNVGERGARHSTHTHRPPNALGGRRGWRRGDATADAAAACMPRGRTGACCVLLVRSAPPAAPAPGWLAGWLASVTGGRGLRARRV